MRAVAVVYTYIILLMLSDLASQGCAEPGSEAVNNPLSRLGKAVLDYGRQQAHVGGSSMEGGGNTSANDATLPLHHQNIMMPQPSLGPTGLLPEMGPSEQQFLRAFEAGDVLQRGWEHAADVNRKAPAFVPSVGRGEFAWGEAAWEEAASGANEPLHVRPPHRGANMPHPHPPHVRHFPYDHPFNERHHLHRHPGNLLVNAFPPHLQALEHGWRDASQVENAAQSTMRESTGRFSTAAPTASPLSANEVRLLDDAHERAWQSLASEPETPALRDDIHHTSSDSNAATSAFSELEAVWQNLSLEGREAAGKALVGDGAADMETVWKALSGGDYEASWNDAWDGLSANEDALFATDDASAPYRFHSDNPFLGGTDLLERGTSLFREGDLSKAVLVLEAAVQAQPDDTIAWQTLGQAHADADDDARAIPCLRRAVAADPHNLDALLALGVSYTNELDQSRALRHLQLWLESHPDFIDIPDSSLNMAWAQTGRPSEYENPFELQQKVTNLFLRAAQKQPNNADLHAVLGVLYNLARSYPNAVNSFEAALRLRPTDYSLWNKLGATQANAMSCAEAVPCYIKALELKPQYVRALSNLGISYGNMANYEAAAQCYLKALSLNSEAVHLWGYLTMTFTSMGRQDLLSKASGANVDAFRPDFDF